MLVLCLFMVTPAVSVAQVTLDGTVGPGVPQALVPVGNEYQITSDLGTTAGNNLFHSFGDFNLSEGQTATFSGPANINNVIARVTGGNPSFIDGTLRSTIAGADFFLINPAAVFFGPNARLDVGGSFVVTTANELRLADGGVFSATDPGASVLTTAAPSAFGFMPNPGVPGNPVAPIIISGLTMAGATGDLTVSSGQVLSAVGGDIVVQGSEFAAPEGRVNLVSVASAGVVEMAATEIGPLDVGPCIDGLDSFQQLGGITITGGADVNIDGAGGGRMAIRGGRLVVDQAFVTAFTGAIDSGPIDIAIDGEVQISNGGRVGSVTNGPGGGAGITIAAENMLISGPSLVLTTTGLLTTGDAGDIDLHLSGSLQMTEFANLLSDTSGTGRGGNITIRAAELMIGDLDTTHDSFLITIAATSGQGAATHAQLAMFTTEQTAGLLSMVTGEGGSIDITADQVILAERSVISASSFAAGRGGDLSVHARLVQIGIAEHSVQSALSAQTAGDGDGGDILIEAESLRLINGGVVNATTIGSGDAGDILVTVDELLLDNMGSPLGTFIAAQSDQMVTMAGMDGDAGRIVIDARSVEVTNGAFISATTTGFGAGGIAAVHAAESVHVGNGSTVSATTDAQGAGGEVIIESDHISIDGGNVLSISSGEDGLGTTFGQAGTIRLSAGTDILLKNNALVATSATQADGGDIGLDSGRRINIVNSQVTADAGLNGGNITINSPALVRISRGSVTAGAQGDGGNILIDTGAAVLNNGLIQADAIGGDGGQVTILSGVFFATPDTIITADSEAGVPGTVSVNSPDTDLAGSLASLPEGLLDMRAVLVDTCWGLAQSDTRQSSFVVGGQEGLPNEPGGLQPYLPACDAYSSD